MLNHNAQLKLFTSQKIPHDINLVKFFQTMLRFQKVPRKNSKIGKLFITLATSNFQLFVMILTQNQVS